MNEPYKCNETIYPQDGILSINDIPIMSDTQCNVMNQGSIDYHMQFDPSEYAPILGYFDTISEEDSGSILMDGDMVDELCYGMKVFKVIRGHHRALCATKQMINVSYSLV